MKAVKTLDFQFSEKHIDYMRKCQRAEINVAEGAVRAGKTIDNVFVFANELETAPDVFHLASGSTTANAKLNIGVGNGYGLEGIFRGRCRWTKYKGNDALAVKTPTGVKYVIFAGAGKADSFKKIRGNSYGMWIATEINLHHDQFIKEAFNRQLAAKHRKIFWDLNPDHPKAPIYVEYIDKYARKQAENGLKGGYNYAHFTIYDNLTVTKERLEVILSQYDKDSIWYQRDILGKRSIAENLIYRRLATAIATGDKCFCVSKKTAVEMANTHQFIKISIGVDFGGNGSGHAFVACAETLGYGNLIVLRSERYLEGTVDPETKRKLKDIDPQMLSALFLRFVRRIIKDYGFVTKIYVDSEEQVLKRGFQEILNKNMLGNLRVSNARKGNILNRIRATSALIAQNRIQYTEDCQSFQEAVSQAVWKPDTIEWERLDDGTSDIDTLDAFEYAWERDINSLVKDIKEMSP